MTQAPAAKPRLNRTRSISVATSELHPEAFKTLNSISTPRVMRVVGWILVCGMALVALFLVFAPWVQTAAGTGSVTALNPNDRLQEINALVPGRIHKWHVRDGSRVKVGDPIVRIVDNDPQLLERLQAERAQVVASLRAAEAAVTIAEVDRQRMENLYQQGLASQRDFEQARIRVEQLRGEVAAAAAQVSRVDVSLSRQSVQIVRAPRDGVILRVNAGDEATFVAAGQVVATFVPDNVERAVELFIDGRDVALIRQDAPVRLQFEGWPVEDKAAANPWPDQRFVRFGSKARGWVLLEEVSVGFEIWRQLNNFPPNFPASGGA
jgi:multidrug efflux pump subunit AcrA (membrane-fusion protein)